MSLDLAEAFGTLPEPLPMPLSDLMTFGDVHYTSINLIDFDDSSSESSDDDDDELTEIIHPVAQAQLAKRNAQLAAFDDFLHGEADQDPKSAGELDVATDKPAAEEVSTKLIDKAREYQQELFERAKEENVIAVLDTGSGKTLIACLLIKHVQANEVVDRANRKPPRIVVFLANSVHLVQQQAQVLANNLSNDPLVFVGGNKAEMWRSPEVWATVIERNNTIVCTPAVLQQCLDNANVRIDQISLLIFDEAHHTKKSHTYSTIMRSHYIPCPPDMRPKIFGMTASPVDTKGTVQTSAADLEQLLDSKIVTTSDLSILSFAPKPQDVIWRYPRARMTYETDLFQRLLPLCSHSKDTKVGFAFAKNNIMELGSWCVDQVWRYVIGTSATDSASLVRKFEQSLDYIHLPTIEERAAALQSLQCAVDILKHHYFPTPTPTLTHLSPKVHMLYEELYTCYKEDPLTRAIVFVDQRLTATVLRDCFDSLNIPNLRPSVLLGTAQDSSTLVKQQNILDHFRIGLINLVFATSVADEGIDIPQCNLCIRFDLYKSPIQYMQSRGRARMKGSMYVHMIEEDNLQHENEVKYAIASDKYIRDFCQTLPPDRLLGRGTKLAKMIAQDSSTRSFKTESNAICNFGNSLLVLARFASSLQHLGALTKETYEEEIDLTNNMFRYVVRLPPNTGCSTSGARGDWRKNKQLAKRSAAFNCCFLLRRDGNLDSSLHSVYKKVKPENLNALLAVSEKSSTYPMNIKPAVWSQDPGEIPKKLFVASVAFHPDRPLRRPLSSMVLFTRTIVPITPQFQVYLEDNIPTTVSITPLHEPITLTSEELELLTHFTLDGIFADVFNKVYEPDSSKMVYWLAPQSPKITTLRTLSGMADVKALEAVRLGRMKWSVGMDAEKYWSNRFLCDPSNGKYHYFTNDVVAGAHIHDQIPSGVPKISGKGTKNIIDFTDSHWKASKKKHFEFTYDVDQPILSAELLSIRRNYLEKSTEQDQLHIMCQIAPQPLEVSQLSPEFAASCLVWPAVIHRLEAYMMSLEAFERLGLPEVPADLALEAFTKAGGGDDDDQQLHLHDQRGMGKNYERLEFIGDSLLKMMTTITVFNLTKCDEEGMHCRRMEILCNRRLFQISTFGYHLYRYARTSGFNRATWYPQHLVLLKGRGAKKPPEPVKHAEVLQELSMKTIADISEAIIGAAVVSSKHKLNKFDPGILAITNLVDSLDHPIESWSELSSMYKPPEWSLLTNDVQANKLAEDIYDRTGYRFNHPRLLRSAFTHSSDTNATVPDLQRLEFLGDAILDWVCISWLFEENPTRNPQWLTEHKMAMVSNKFLAALAVVLDFDKFIACSTAKLYADITTYSKHVRSIIASQNRVDNETNEGAKRDFWWTRIDSSSVPPPKALSDLVESYLGAVLIDSDFNYDEIERFFNKHVKYYFEDISRYDGFANRHPTSYLHKKLVDEYHCDDFKVLASDPTNLISGSIGNVVITAGVLVHGKVIASSKGTGAKYAKVRACKQALSLLEGLKIEEFREKFGCDCRLK